MTPRVAGATAPSLGLSSARSRRVPARAHPLSLGPPPRSASARAISPSWSRPRSASRPDRSRERGRSQIPRRNGGPRFRLDLGPRCTGSDLTSGSGWNVSPRSCCRSCPRTARCGVGPTSSCRTPVAPTFARSPTVSACGASAVANATENARHSRTYFVGGDSNRPGPAKAPQLPQQPRPLDDAPSHRSRSGVDREHWLALGRDRPGRRRARRLLRRRVCRRNARRPSPSIPDPSPSGSSLNDAGPMSRTARL
jgi:hypothetical protein